MKNIPINKLSIQVDNDEIIFTAFEIKIAFTDGTGKQHERVVVIENLKHQMNGGFLGTYTTNLSDPKTNQLSIEDREVEGQRSQYLSDRIPYKIDWMRFGEKLESAIAEDNWWYEST